jgi:hypothetical protein
MYINIRVDLAMPIPGFSFVEQDIHGRFCPVIILNPTLIPDDPNVIAHIMGHEWGHHALRHIERVSDIEGQDRRQTKENEADAYAAKFIKTYDYDVEVVSKFLKEHSLDIENRIQILTETLPDECAPGNSSLLV